MSDDDGHQLARREIPTAREACPACDSGGCMATGAPRRDTVYRHSTPEHLVAEVVELRALVSRLKACLKHVRPFVTTTSSHHRINESVDDHGGLDYEIH